MNSNAFFNLPSLLIFRVNRTPETYLASADFLELEETCLVNLLQSEDLACQEIKLFEAVVRYYKISKQLEVARIGLKFIPLII